MALLCSEVRTESFDKPPPPKKKWIQDYLEKTKQSDKAEDGDSVDPPSGSVAGAVQVVIDQFQDYIHETKKRNLKVLQPCDNPSDASKNRTIESLLNPANHGTKFNCSLIKISSQSAAELQPLVDPDQLTQHDIGGVVQGVISSFLNGNLGDSNFRLSRKRCKRHENCSGRKDHHKGRHDVKRRRCSGHLAEIPSNVNGPTLDFNPFSDSRSEEDGVLNLSLPKASSKVTFATEDRCYGIDSLRSSKTSKSQEMYNQEALEHNNTLLPDHRFPCPGSPPPLQRLIPHHQRIQEPPTLLRIQESPTLQRMPVPQNMYPLIPSMSMPSNGSQTKGYLVPKPLSSLLQVPEPLVVSSSPVNLVLNHSIYKKSQPYSVIKPPLCPERLSSVPEEHIPRHIPGNHIGNPHNSFDIPLPPPPKLLHPHPQIHPPQPQLQHHQPHPQRWSPIIVKTSSKNEPSPQQVQHDAGLPPHKAQHVQRDAGLPSHKAQHVQRDAVLTSHKAQHVQRDAGLPPHKAQHVQRDAVLPYHKAQHVQRDAGLPSHMVFPKCTTGTKESKYSASQRKEKAVIKDPLKLKQKPDAAKDKKTSSGYTREMHNIMEKNRRAQLKNCFDEVALLCELDPKKTSNLSVIRSAFKFIMRLRREARDQETELANLALDKVKLKQRLEKLKTELPGLVAKNI